mmetsp:Transcript_18552/g.47736  ORF Transcript_18552/g.47736 Transcript_18552/m.47736 type:complete len:170 (+) Transcript_18552:185-694(+)|eukprot:CAMPEP_0119413334 /NCGR_PEP_ID=MMETSP1335-20130426/5454_1 /TAXON_ID=259385 /ORGANISM="Chrysoculter rhomboideus, Strain RCC1486" /LENGTH=169 /DNA_ID=CAMNT_0007438119 /DNA_START=201 /DNA_END=710 /DNA_ORIENTATION=+
MAPNDTFGPDPTVAKASYVGKVAALYVLLFVDATLNSVADTQLASLELAIFITFLQILLRFLALMMLFLLATTTLLFRAGMLDVLLRQFMNVTVASIIGMLIMLALRIFRILLLFYRVEPETYFAVDGYLALYVTHNLCSVLLYWLSIAATFRLSDPAFYDPSVWRRVG